MPKHLQWLQRHVHDHPGRLVLTSIAVLLSSLVLLGVALYVNFTANKREADRAHKASVENCVALNELRRQIYVAATDLGINAVIAVRFLPDRNCEVLP